MDAIPAKGLRRVISCASVFRRIHSNRSARFLASLCLLLVSAFYYKSISLKDLPKIFTGNIKAQLVSLFCFGSGIRHWREFLGYYQINATVLPISFGGMAIM